MEKTYLDLLDELRAIAQLGLNYTKDPFDRERYERLMHLSAGRYAEISGLEAAAIKARFARDLGYITPKIGVQGALFEPGEGERILLEKRKDDGFWGLPSGWVEAGERPDQALVREFMEEAGLEIATERILGFYTRLPGEYLQPHTSIHLLYQCRWVGGVLVKSHESLALGYYDYREIPEKEWHKDHRQQAETAVAAKKK